MLLSFGSFLCSSLASLIILLLSSSASCFSTRSLALSCVRANIPSDYSAQILMQCVCSMGSMRYMHGCFGAFCSVRSLTFTQFTSTNIWCVGCVRAFVRLLAFLCSIRSIVSVCPTRFHCWIWNKGNKRVKPLKRLKSIFEIIKMSTRRNYTKICIITNCENHEYSKNFSTNSTNSTIKMFR